MKVLHINKFYYPQGGAEQYFFDLTKLLEQRGVSVVPFAMEHPKNIKTRYRSNFVSQVNFEKPSTVREKARVVGRMIYSLEARRKVKELVVAEKPDIVHLENIYHQLSPSFLSLLHNKFRLPIVQTLHDYKLICPNEFLFTQGAVCERCKTHKYYNAARYRCVKNSTAGGAAVALEMYVHRLFRFYERNVDLWIAPSQFMRDKMVGWGKDPNQFRVLNNFVDTRAFTPNPSEKDYFLFVGRLATERGVPMIIKAAKRVPNVKIKIAGTGPEEEYLKGLVRSEGLENNIEFLGFVPHDQIPQLMAQSLALLFPTEVYEGYPLVVLEAFACGRAVLGTDLGATGDMIAEGERGAKFMQGDHIMLARLMEFVRSNPKERATWGRNARRYAEARSTENYSREILNIYQELLAKRQTTKP